MIKYTPASERTLSLFDTPFEQQLDSANRWVRMAALVPWDNMAKIFFDSMSVGHGRASVDLRIVMGALLVKHVEGISDEDTIQYIQENMYAQYFVGLSSFQTEPVFVPTLFVEIRKRLGKQGAQRLNDEVLKQAVKLRAIKHRAKASKQQQDDHDDTSPNDRCSKIVAQEQDSPSATADQQVRNKGKLKLDATVAPQHIGYPTDSRLLHEARQESERLIDLLYHGHCLWKNKPRTYRRIAHKQYLAFAKRRNPRKATIKKACGQQLRYLRRNLKYINQMLDEIQQQQLTCSWTHKEWHRLWVLQELYRQQECMYRDGRRRIAHRIVNIAQPYVRPIQRGKAGKKTEFGAKLNVAQTEGFARIDQLSFDNFNEGTKLEEQIESFKRLFGYYPELVLVDRIYLTRQNRKYLKSKGIRHSGKPLGKQPAMNRAEKLKRKKEQNKRSEIEGKFGQAKSKYGLDDVQTRRMDTSFACIGLIFLALNMIKLAKASFLSFFNLYDALGYNKSGQMHNFDKTAKLIAEVSPLKSCIDFKVRPKPVLTF